MSATSWLVKAYVFGTALQTANGFRASTTGSLAVVYVLWRDLNAAGVPFGDVVIGIVRFAGGLVLHPAQVTTAEHS